MTIRTMLALVALAACGSCGCARDGAPPPAQATTSAAEFDSRHKSGTTELTNAVTGKSRRQAERVRAHVEERVPELVERCGHLHVQSEPYATSLDLEITADGTVEIAYARGENAALDACIAETVRTWTFDPMALRTVTSVPLVLERR